VFHSISIKSIYGYLDLSFLYEKLAGLLDVDPHNLLLSHGSDGVIRSVFEVFINRGDKVLITSPTFIMYEIYAKIYGAKLIEVNYSASDSGPILDFDLFLNTVKKTRPKLVCFPNPDSPTGVALNVKQLQQLISTCKEIEAIVLIDEAYYPFCDTTALKWINKYSNLVIARTFAKAWGLAGLRIGYAIGGKRIINLLHKVRPMYEVSSVAAEIVNKTIDYHDEVLRSVHRLKAGNGYFLDRMSKIGFPVFEGSGNFSLVKFGNNSNHIHSLLKDIVLYKQSFDHPALSGYSRFSSAPISTMKVIADKIEEAAYEDQ
jgi:histidinol-phosphate aminotransferase